MTLCATGIRPTRSTQTKKEKSGADTATLVNATWYFFLLSLAQLGPTFNTVMREKYTYSIPIIQMREELRKSDRG